MADIKNCDCGWKPLDLDNPGKRWCMCGKTISGEEPVKNKNRDPKSTIMDYER